MIIKVKSCYMLKLPQGEWLNLAAITRVNLDNETGIVYVHWEDGRRVRYSGSQAAAILEALNESEHIDKSHITESEVMDA